MPRTYIQDTLPVSQNKWNPNNAAPGTMVMVIMFHGINKDEGSLDDNDITVKDFEKLMKTSRSLAFKPSTPRKWRTF